MILAFDRSVLFAAVTWQRLLPELCKTAVRPKQG